MTPFLASLVFATGIATSPPPLTASNDSVPRWLLGCWQSASGNARSVQRWVQVGSSVLFGASWTTRGARLVALDVMRIARSGDSLALELVPLDASPTTERIELVRVDDDRFRYRHGTRKTDSATYRKVGCETVLRPARNELPAMQRLHAADERAVVAGDADALERLWTDDIVAVPPGGPASAGRAVNSVALRRSLAINKDYVTVGYTLHVDTTHVVGDYAIEWGQYEGRVRARADTGITTMGGSMLRIIRRGPDGAWRVARTMFTASASR